jgi:dTDP-4-dehydrorhamnose 3,5-epimerase
MPILIKETSIPDLLIILTHQVNDERGYLTKYYDKNIFKEKGVTVDFIESTQIMSKKGVLRGLHYQKNPSQARLIHVNTGSIFNAALDLRPSSDTFGKYETFYLSREKAIFVPEGFANGFLAIDNDTIITCHFTNKFVAENNNGIIWNDLELQISWPFEKMNVPLIISEKDKTLQPFNQFKKDTFS